MISLINLIKILLLKILSLLPDSPFSDLFDEMDTSFFQYLNWFLPLDICLNIFLAWISAMLAVLLILLVKKYLVDKAIDFILSLTGFFKFLV